MTWRRVLSILRFPAGLAILLAVTFQVASDVPALRTRTVALAPGGAKATPVSPGDGGVGIFVLLVPLMTAGVITAVILLQRPTWGIGRRVALAAAVGAVVSLAAYLSAVGLQLLPDQPLLLAYAFLLTQLASTASIAAGPYA